MSTGFNSVWIVLVGLSLILVPAVDAHSSIYYVDQKHPRASDDNPGSAARPWRSISQAARTLKPGDRVLVKEGVYRETIRPARSGEPGKPIIYEAFPGHTVVIKGSYPVSGWQRAAGITGNVWRKADWRTGLPKGEDIASRVRLIVQKDGALGEAVVLFGVSKKEELREGSFYQDAETLELFLWPEGNTDPNVQSPEVAVRENLFVAEQKNHLRVRGFQFRHGSERGVWLWGDHNLLENNVITWSGLYGFSLMGHDCIIRNNVFAHNGNLGMSAWGTGHLIEGNCMTHNNLRRFEVPWQAGGAKMCGNWEDATGKKRGGVNNCIIRSNEFAYNIGHGLWLDWENNDNIIENNRFHDNEGCGLDIEACRRNLVRNNLAYRNRLLLGGHFLVYKPGLTSPDEFPSELRQSSNWCGSGIYISGSPGTMLLHNTCYGNESAGICVCGAEEVYIGLGTNNPAWAKEWPEHGSLGAREIVVVNNILMNNQKAQLVLRHKVIDGVDKTRNVSNYNLLFSSTGRLAVIKGTDVYGPDGCKIYTTLEEWQKVTGQDKHSVWGEPMFVRAVADDFRLQHGSAAIGRALPLREVPTDIRDLPRKPTPDIGAYETGAAQIPPEGGTPQLSQRKQRSKTAKTGLRRLEHRPADLDVEPFVSMLQRAGFDALVSSGTNSSVGAHFSSKLRPIHSPRPDEYLPELIRRCHDADMLVLSWVPFNIQDVTDVADFVPAHLFPEWQMQFINPPPPEKVDSVGMCIFSSPYREEHAKFIQEIMLLGFDGVMFDGTTGTGLPNSHRVGCVCDYCKKAFAQETGLQLPSEINWQDRTFKHWVKWRYDKFVETMGYFTRKIREIRPDARISFGSAHRPSGPGS